jgi:hypothetical protein
MNNKDKKILSAYVDGELSASEKKYIEEKLKSSLELQKYLSDLKQIKELTANSTDRISESPYFETRLFTSINSEAKTKFNIKKWIPITSAAVITIAVLVLLKINPAIIENIINQQKSSLSALYKENLQPLLYAADLTNEDIFNFAVYHELPLDQTNNQKLKLGYDSKGSEYFEIKKVNDSPKEGTPDNLNRFISALALNKSEIEKIDSIIESYSDQISSLVLVNDKNDVAINPKIWNTRKLILADILSFAEKHAQGNLYKILPKESLQFDDLAVAKWVKDTKAGKDDQYIFCTQDSIFEEPFLFDMADFKKNMKKVTKELEELQKQEKVAPKYIFKNESLTQKSTNGKNWTKQFKVFIDTDIIKVSVQSLTVDIPKIDIPNFDSIAIVIQEATQIIPTFRRPSNSPVTVGEKSYDYNYRTVTPKRKRESDVNLDSLLQINNQQNTKQKINNDDAQNSLQFLYNDSLIIMQNNELKKEMDNLRKELQKFREELKDSSSNSNNSQKQKKEAEKRIIET